MRFSRRRLNRTLLLRQHLLERVASTPEQMAVHLVGLQAQDQLPPYVGLAARLTDLDPHEVTRALEEKRLVRVLSLRDTVHLHVPDDALSLPVWAEPVRARELAASQSIGEARQVDPEAFSAAVADILADGPMASARLGTALAARFPDHRPTALGHVARVREVLAQLPPRGTWKPAGSTGVVYDHLTTWLGRPLSDPDVPAIVRRYLRAFGPATAADVTAWSGITRLGPVLSGMADLERHEDADGRTLYDVAGAPVADEDAPAPVRLLGTYDNVWLSHASRDRVTEPDARKAWMGSNGGVGSTLFVDGWLTGIWKVEDGRVVVRTLLRDLTPAEEDELDEEIDRVEALLAR